MIIKEILFIIQGIAKIIMKCVNVETPFHIQEFLLLSQLAFPSYPAHCNHTAHYKRNYLAEENLIIFACRPGEFMKGNYFYNWYLHVGGIPENQTKQK